MCARKGGLDWRLICKTLGKGLRNREGDVGDGMGSDEVWVQARRCGGEKMERQKSRQEK
jgi:hypothetical protein